jgi:hypothetical protein
MQWAASLALDLFFYYFLIHFITAIPDASQLDANWDLVRQWSLADPQDYLSSSWLWASHARQISFFFCFFFSVQWSFDVLSLTNLSFLRHGIDLYRYQGAKCRHVFCRYRRTCSQGKSSTTQQNICEKVWYLCD